MWHRAVRSTKFRRLRTAAAISTCACVIASVGAELSLASGAKLWEKRDGTNLHSIVSSPDGTKVFVTGVRITFTDQGDFLTVARDSVTGAKLWAKGDDGGIGGIDAANAIVVSPDGAQVFVTGTSEGSTTDYDYLTISYDASTGVKLWSKRYNGPADGADGRFLQALAVSPDGTKVIVTGGSPGTTTGDDFATIAYDATTGAKLWLKRYSGPGNNSDVATDVVMSPDGTKVIVTGDSYAAATNTLYFATIAYDASTGAKLWLRRFTGPLGSALARSAAVSNDGKTVFVTGQAFVRLATGGDYATVAYRTATGRQLWARFFNGPGNGYDDARDVAVSPDSTAVFVTGNSPGSTGANDDYLTIAYDAVTGARLWTKRYDGPGTEVDSPSSLAVSLDGAKVFVTGVSAGSTSSRDWATIAYAASTGARLWVRRHNSPGNGLDAANDVAVSPHGGSVFVTGLSFGTDGEGTTIAYAA